MEKIHILTDSSSDIPHDLVEAHGIEIVPIMLTHEGRSFREYYDITSEDYCKLLETSSEIPGTAMTTPTVFLESYNRAFERGCTHLLAVLINGGGSGTYQAACLAKSMFEEEQGEGKMTIEVIDSKTYTYIYGHIVVKAAEMREQGESFDAIVSVVKSRLNRVEAYLGVYSLKFLKKSGRISGGAAFVGEALGLKPISHVYDGAVKVCDKVRGEKALVAGMSKKSPPVWCSRISRRLSCSTATYLPSVWMKWKSVCVPKLIPRCGTRSDRSLGSDKYWSAGDGCSVLWNAAGLMQKL